MHESPVPSLLRPGLPENWLVMRLGHMGDVALTTGVLQYLGHHFGWKFHVLTKPAWTGIFDRHPHVEKTVAFTPDTGFARLAAQYTGWGFLDLNANLRSRMLGLLWKGPVARYPKFSLDRRLFLHAKNAGSRERLLAFNVPQRYALAVLRQAPDQKELLPKIFLSPDEAAVGKERIAALLARRSPGGPQATPIQTEDRASGRTGGQAPVTVALHPYASYPEKTWPAEYWRDLVRLLDAAGMAWVAVGKGEPLFDGRPEDLANKTGLRETCAILAASACLVSGDSGPLHLASGTGTPVVGMFGPTTREWGFFPSGRKDVILETSCPCRPCSLHGRKRCGHDNACLKEITPVMVLAEIEKLAASGKK